MAIRPHGQQLRRLKILATLILVLAVALTRAAHPGGHFLDRDPTREATAIAAMNTMNPMVPVSKSDANEAGRAVLRSCCMEPFVADGKSLELLRSACSAAQHGSGDRTKPKLRETLISSA